MCGICGILHIGESYAVPDRLLVRDMTRRLTHRGPDHEGYYDDPVISLGHRRLQIIDLVSGNQPIANEDNTIQVIFNGEIYNYNELRRDLIRDGHVFTTSSDTETIVHLYEKYGANFISHVDGMFAIALWDMKKRSLYLYRDRLGQKPLYYYRKDHCFYFASEIKSLACIPGVTQSLDMRSVFDYSVLSYCPPPQTIFSDVKKVLPGRCVHVEQGGRIHEHVYWRLDTHTDTTRSIESMRSELKQVMLRAVSARMHSDVPLGAFLSGGLDSSIIVALMCSLSKEKIKTFSIGFDDPAYNELSYATEVASFLNTEHHEEIVRPDVSTMLDEYVYSLDQPLADSSSLPTFFLSKMTREYVTVALSGDGGDECFAGYPRYYVMNLLQSLAAKKIPYKTLLRVCGAFLACFPDGGRAKSFTAQAKKMCRAAAQTSSVIDMYNEWFCHYSPRELPLLFSAHASGYSFDYLSDIFNNVQTDSVLDQIMTTDIYSYLPNDLLHKVDSMSMAHSLEVRSPFLDHHVVECAARIAFRHKISFFDSKIILKQAFGPLLPPSILRRRKMGFGVPLARWLRHDLRSLIKHVLSGKRIQERGILNTAYLKNLMDQHLSGKYDHAYKLWNSLVFELWCQKFMDGQTL